MSYDQFCSIAGTYKNNHTNNNQLFAFYFHCIFRFIIVYLRQYSTLAFCQQHDDICLSESLAQRQRQNNTTPLDYCVSNIYEEVWVKADISHFDFIVFQNSSDCHFFSRKFGMIRNLQKKRFTRIYQIKYA